MRDLVVVTFSGPGDGIAALARVRDLERTAGLKVDDTAVVEKAADGKVQVRNEVDSGVKSGALGGGVLGLLIGGLFFPVVGLAIGAIGGALVGRSLEHGIDPAFVRDVTSELGPGTSALFVVTSGGASALVTALRPFEGKVYQTTLPPETERALEEALRQRQ